MARGAFGYQYSFPKLILTKGLVKWTRVEKIDVDGIMIISYYSKE